MYALAGIPTDQRPRLYFFSWHIRNHFARRYGALSRYRLSNWPPDNRKRGRAGS